MSWDEDLDHRMRRWRQMPFFSFRGFEEIDRMFDDMVQEMFKNAPKDLYRERKLPSGGTVKEMGPFVYGYSMTVGPDGKPIVREFGNVRPTSKQTRFGRQRPSLEVREEREPLIDTISENGTIRVLAEVPGVDKSNIKLNCSETALTITVDDKMRKYYKEVSLPQPVDPKVAKATYKNGVLEVLLTKKTKEAPKGETISID
jgi:HSP20 family protein